MLALPDLIDEHVARLYVAMDESAFMRSVEGICHLSCDSNRAL